MKIAVSTDSGFVSPHFGRCALYTIAEVEGGQVLSTEQIINPGHRPGFLPQFLSEKGVSCIICGGMGYRAELLFRERGIETIMGVTGGVEETIRRFAGGQLRQGESLCARAQSNGDEARECHHEKEVRDFK